MATATSKGDKKPRLVPYTLKQFRALINEVREKVPAPHGTTIEFHRSKNLESIGLCRFDHEKKTFHIYVRTDLTFDSLCEVMVHEMAHVFDWCAISNYLVMQDDHGPTWSIWYGKIYQIVWQTK